MATIRQAAVAGQFYPGTAEELTATIEHYLAGAAAPAGPVPKAIIAPHAGYVYSGPVAASAYARIRPAAGRIRRVVLLGPCHRVPLRGLALSSAEAFATPLGTVPLDRELEQKLLELPQVQVFDETHFQEHSLEVHVPFLQVILDDFTLVPMVVGEATPDEVAEVLEAAWGGPETLIVISSDLSHYEGYDAARRIDHATCQAIEALDAAAIGHNQACGRVPVGGLLALARRRGLEVSTVDLRNSGDTAGPRDRVVGYGSWVFAEPPRKAATPAGAAAGVVAGAASGAAAGQAKGAENDFAAATRALLEAHGETLLHVAAASIEHGLRQGRPMPIDPTDYAADLRADGASFVTLKRDGRLRGCIGTWMARQPLVECVADHAFSAAFKDPRFPPLAAEEIDGLSLSVSVLSAPAPMTFADEADLLGQLKPGVDGLIIEDAGRRALFLPAVWETLPRKEDFLGHLKVKAGLLAGHWSGGFKAWHFVAEETSSDDLDDAGILWDRLGVG